MAKVRAHVYISGHVTGVFFRYHTHELAQRLGLRGWVRNTPSGGVEAVFEGEKDEVDKILEFCRRGSPGARVTGVDTSWEEYKGEFKTFSIRYW